MERLVGQRTFEKYVGFGEFENSYFYNCFWRDQNLEPSRNGRFLVDLNLEPSRNATNGRFCDRWFGHDLAITLKKPVPNPY